MIAKIGGDVWIGLSIGAMIATCLALVFIVGWASTEVWRLRKLRVEEQDRAKKEIAELNRRLDAFKADPTRPLPDGETSGKVKDKF